MRGGRGYQKPQNWSEAGSKGGIVFPTQTSAPLKELQCVKWYCIARRLLNTWPNNSLNSAVAFLPFIEMIMGISDTGERFQYIFNLGPREKASIHFRFQPRR